MTARRVTVSPRIQAAPHWPDADVPAIPPGKRASVVALVDGEDRLVAIVGDGDVLHDPRCAPGRRLPRWPWRLIERARRAADIVRSCGRRLAALMTIKVVAAPADAPPLPDVGGVRAHRTIRPAPPIGGSAPVALAGRADRRHAAAADRRPCGLSASDTRIRNRLVSRLNCQAWTRTSLLNITVTNGVVHLWGVSESSEERMVLHATAESVPGVQAVADYMLPRFDAMRDHRAS